MDRVFVASPFTAPTFEGIARHIRYARACCYDCFKRGEAPYVGHLQNTQPGILRDEVPEERDQAIKAGLRWMAVCDRLVVYTDLGISSGMDEEIKYAREVLGIKVECRELGEGWEKTLASGIYPDEVVVVRDRHGNIDELFASSTYFHIERMNEGWYWFQLSDQHFGVSSKDGDAVLEFSGDAGHPWSPDDPTVDADCVEVIEGDGPTTHRVRPCPNPDCGEVEDLKLEMPLNTCFVACRGCGMNGPYFDSDPTKAVQAWNDLPRRPYWTRRKESA